MVIKKAALDIVCGITSVLPKNQIPEIAFAGKSNVGKSSVINRILQRKNFARVGDQWTDEPQVAGSYQCSAGQDSDH